MTGITKPSSVPTWVKRPFFPPEAEKSAWRSGWGAAMMEGGFPFGHRTTDDRSATAKKGSPGHDFSHSAQIQPTPALVFF
jgi:hypothetical protein